MATETLTVDGSGSLDQWQANSGTKADALATSDSDTLYVYSEPSVYAPEIFPEPGSYQDFTFSNPTVIGSSDTILAVVFSGLFRKDTASSVSLRVSAYNGTSFLALPIVEIVDTSYATYTWSFEESPAGALWTLTELNSLRVRLNATGTNLRCTYLVANVQYVSYGVFQYGRPNSWEDAENGGYCAMTGMWAPAHLMVNGYIRDYAPMDEIEQIEHPIRPRTGKT